MNHNCECELAGFCARHGVTKSLREHDLCRHAGCSLEASRKYWAAWEAGKLRGQTGPVAEPKPWAGTENAARAIAPVPKVSCCGGGTKSPESLTRGPGYALKKMLEAIGIRPTADCPCIAYAAKMDEWGTGGCRQRRDEIVQHLRDGSHQWGWMAWIAAGARAVRTGLAFQVNWLDPFPAMVDEAIRQAEEFQFSQPPDGGPRPPLIGVPIDRSKLVSHILYHVMPVAGDTEWVWRRHLARLREVRHQFNGRLIVGIVTPGKGDHWRYCPPPAVRDALAGLGAEFIEHPNPVKGAARAGKGEGALFPRMLSMLETDDPNQIAYYGHCKGVTRPGLTLDAPTHLWGDAMFDLLFRNQGAVVESLDGHGIMGSFLMRGGHGPGLPGLGQFWFYSGTFFALRLADAFRRSWRFTPDYYGAVEQWPRLMFDRDTEAGCLFWCDAGNLYDENDWRENITPALNKWKATRDGTSRTTAIL